jgi:hypothetical protein
MAVGVAADDTPVVALTSLDRDEISSEIECPPSHEMPSFMHCDGSVIGSIAQLHEHEPRPSEPRVATFT